MIDLVAVATLRSMAPRAARDAGRRCRSRPRSHAGHPTRAAKRPRTSPSIGPTGPPALDPARAARPRRRRGGSSWSRSCARAGSRSGRVSPSSRRPSRARLGVAHASAVSSGTAGLHLALRAAGRDDGDEVVTSPFSFVASANAIVYERARPVFADIDPVTLNLDPRRRGRGGDRAHARAAAGAHLRLPGRPAGVRAPAACRSSRTPARRSAPSTPTGRRSAPRPPGGLRLLRQQADDDRRGRHGHAPPTRR